MSKVDNRANIEIANNFIRRYGAIFSKKQIRVLIERISTKESRICKHVLENGSKRLPRVQGVEKDHAIASSMFPWTRAVVYEGMSEG